MRASEHDRARRGRKFGDGRGASLAALLTYYGFLSIFPLLLILTTVLGFVGNDDVSDSVIGNTLQQFPCSVNRSAATSTIRPRAAR
ncbi:MAG: YhjD/YihY/BrkB family envelope integrity protein [Acidimicrobiia bacterium]